MLLFKNAAGPVPAPINAACGGGVASPYHDDGTPFMPLTADVIELVVHPPCFKWNRRNCTDLPTDTVAPALRIQMPFAAAVDAPLENTVSSTLSAAPNVTPAQTQPSFPVVIRRLKLLPFVFLKIQNPERSFLCLIARGRDIRSHIEHRRKSVRPLQICQ